MCSGGCLQDRSRRAADWAFGPSGVRFNRSRPYVAVHEPFIVGSKTYLVTGQISPDGKFVLITGSTDNLDGYLRATLGSSIEGSRVLLASPSAQGGGVQAAADPSSLIPTLPSITGDREDTDTSEPEPGNEELGLNDGEGIRKVEKTGQGQLKVVNDNNAFSVQPMRRYFDIVYLPDFEEEFVVQVKERMGNASAGITLGQGWSLQGLETHVDNDAITSRLFDLYDESIKILLQLGKAAVGLPGLPSGSIQSGSDERSADTLPAGTNVTIKVTVVRMVAPGLYPILKPLEGEYVNKNIGTLKTSLPDLERRVLIPVYPMTNIAFNTYESIVIEAAPAVGDSPLRLQQYVEPIGISGSQVNPGNNQTYDLSDPLKRDAMEKLIAGQLNSMDPDRDYTASIGSKNNGYWPVTIVLPVNSPLTPAVVKVLVDKVAEQTQSKLQLVQ